MTNPTPRKPRHMNKHIEHFEVRAGRAIPIVNRLHDEGFVEPTGVEVVELPPAPISKFGSPRRIALYPANGPRPWPVASQQVIQPGALSRNDLKNLIGPLMPYLLRRALNLAEDVKGWQWLMLALVFANTAVGGILLWKLW